MSQGVTDMQVNQACQNLVVAVLLCFLAVYEICRQSASYTEAPASHSGGRRRLAPLCSAVDTDAEHSAALTGKYLFHVLL